MNYLVVLFKNKSKKRIINKFMTSKKASDFYKNLLDENQDVIFDTKTQNGKPVNYELALLEKKGNQLFPICFFDFIRRCIFINT